jgi:flagellar biosynthesis protein FliR
VRLDDHLLFSAFCVFTRCTSMLMSAPVLGNVVPVTIRVMMGVVLSFSTVGVVQGNIGEVPHNLIGLVLATMHEAVIGLLIGGFMQLLVATAQVAGSFLDVQIGTGSAQIFNPFLGAAASPVAQFKLMLTTVLVLLLNGHRMMIAAFVKSYEMPGPRLASVQNELIAFIGQTSLLALQIAAPVAAVTIVIDLAAGLVNKAVPQTQPFLLSLPAKLAAGIVVLAIGLPALVGAVQTGLDLTFDHLGHVLRGG